MMIRKKLPPPLRRCGDGESYCPDDDVDAVAVVMRVAPFAELVTSRLVTRPHNSNRNRQLQTGDKM
jgi:hypothetical protein